MGNKDIYKVATRYKYVGDEEIYKPGYVFKKNSTVGYESIEGIEFTLEDAGKLFIAVDEMFMNIYNQWENGMNIEEFVRDLRNLMYGDKKGGDYYGTKK